MELTHKTHFLYLYHIFFYNFSDNVFCFSSQGPNIAKLSN